MSSKPKEPTAIDFNLSVSDLLLIDGFAEAFASDDIDALKAILFTNGLDVSRKYGKVVRTHRNLRNQLVTCERYEGLERLDSVWIKSGAASMAAVIGSTEDDNLRFTLRTMSASRQQDQAFD